MSRPATPPRCPIRAVAALLLLAACNDTTVSKYVEPPIVSIENPTAGAVIDANVDVVLQGRVVDESFDEQLAEIAVLWSVDGAKVCDAAVFDVNGITTCETRFSPGSATIKLTITDPAGQTATDSVDVTIAAGNAPAVEIRSPSTGDRVNDREIVLFTASVSDVEDAPTALLVSWESDLDGVLSIGSAASSGDLEFAANTLSVGTHTVSLHVTDSDGNIGVDRVTLFVNGPPEAPTIAISPDPASSDDTLRATIVTAAFDPNDDAIAYAYAWYQNGNPTANVGDAVPAADTSRGDVWRVEVTPSDGFDTGPYGADDIVIGNAAPTLSSASISPISAYTDDVLSATPSRFADSDGDPEGYHYQWSVNSVEIVGATDSTLAGSYFVKADNVTVTVAPWDGAIEGAAVTSGVRTILNSPPSAPGVAVTPEYPEDDDGLACAITTASVDADGDPLTYTYRWTNNGSATAEAAANVNASSTAEGDLWACLVTANDGTTASADGSDSVTVNDYTAPDAPVLSSIDTYRNEDTVTIIGTAEAFTDVTLYYTSTGGAGTDTTTANGGGAFTFSETLTRGVTYSYYATATDSNGNTSGNSNTLSTEACDPWDEYEDASGYGDTCTNPIIDWSTLTDAGTTTLSAVGNLLAAGDDDWYLIETSDTRTTGLNYYRFHVELVAGSGDYSFAVYTGGCTAASLECGSGSSSDPEGSGITEFEAFAQDVGDGTHTIPAETRACQAGSASYNECDNLSSRYYIHIIRLSAYDCANYELQITNGIW